MTNKPLGRRWLGFVAALSIPLVLAAVPASPPPASPVADAAARHDVETIKKLIKSKADVNAPQGDGATALHWAAEYRDAELVKLLIKAGAKPNVTTLNGNYTPLHFAARAGAGLAVTELLKAGADVKATSLSGATALHLAASSGDVVSINALLAKGANPNARELEWDQTPIVFAASANRADAIRALIKGGANVKVYTKALKTADIQAQDRLAAETRNAFAAKLRGDPPPPPPDTAAINAAARAQAAAAAAAGADTAAGGRGARGAQAAGGRGGRGGGGGGGGGRGAGGGGAPMRGLSPGQIQQAIGAGRDVIIKNQKGTDYSEAPVDVDAGFVAGFTALAGGMGGFTPLHIASRDGAIAAVVALIEGGADINARSVHDSTTPLLQAAISGQFDVELELIKRGADVNAANSANGVPPLWATVNAAWVTRTRTPQQQAWQYQKASHLDVIEALVKAGAQVDTKIRSQPFYWAYNGCGNPNCGLESAAGSSALWRAAYSLDIDAMRLLIKYGADPKTFKAGGAGGGRGGGGGGGRGAPGAGQDTSAAAVAAAAGGGRGQGGRQGGGAGFAGRGAAGGGDTTAAGGGRAGRGAGGFGGRGGAVAMAGGDTTAAQGRGGRGGGGGGGGGGGAAPTLDPSLIGAGSYIIHAAAGTGYGNGVGAGNSHRYAPDGWIPALKYVIEELKFDVNMRDAAGATAMHYAAARGDNESIKYLVSKGGDVKVVDNRGRTTVDMANGPAARIAPYPLTIALLESLGAKNNHRCQSC
jgi:ankyrin repeat protein